MAEDSNVLHLDHNENNFNRRISNGNDIFYVTADSECLDTSVDYPPLENGNTAVKGSFCTPPENNLKNMEHPNVPNLNVSRGSLDLSITERFQRMALTSETDSCRNTTENCSESNSDNHLEEVSFHDASDLLTQEISSSEVSKETLIPFEASGLPEEIATSALTPGENVPCHDAASPKSEDADLSSKPQGSMKEMLVPPQDDNISGKDASCHGLVDTKPLLGENLLQCTPNSRLSFPSPIKNNSLQDGTQEVQKEENVSSSKDESTNYLNVSGNGLFGEMPTFQEQMNVSNEASTSSLLIGESNIIPGDEGTMDLGSVPPTENQDLSFFSSLPVKSQETNDCAENILNSVETGNPAVIVPDNFEEHLFKVPTLPEGSTIDPKVALPLNASGLDSESFEGNGSGEEKHDQNVLQSLNVTEHDVERLSPCEKKLPNEEINNPSAMQSLDASGLKQSPRNLNDVASDFVDDFPGMDSDKSAECAKNPDTTCFNNLPCKTTELKDDCLGIPDSMVFTDFTCLDGTGSMENDVFKVPEVPKEEDEEFTDAVQFFKDPSSFQFLENIQTSAPPESVIPRSSLYVAFDPLHSKVIPGSRMQNVPVVARKSDPNTVEPPKDGNKHLVDISTRESVGNILISFDSPMSASRAQVAAKVEDSSVSKQYTEEELQQALKIHELTLQEVYLKQCRELEQELAKTKEESQGTIEKLTLLSRSQHVVLRELEGLYKKVLDGKVEKVDTMEKENEKLKEDLKTAGEDLQSVENTFSDFHKRYEQCKGMLKTYKDNEVLLKQEIAAWKTMMDEQEQKYAMLQERTQEVVNKANAEVANAKKSSEGQVAVLKAQLKKAELKISGLESDIKQIKIENSQLGGICDDLMAKVSES